MYFVSIDVGAQVAIILLACGLGVVIVNCLGHVVFWVELPVQRRLCLIFMSGVGYLQVFRELTGCQRTPGFWGVTNINKKFIF